MRGKMISLLTRVAVFGSMLAGLSCTSNSHTELTPELKGKLYDIYDRQFTQTLKVPYLIPLTAPWPSINERCDRWIINGDSLGPPGGSLVVEISKSSLEVLDSYLSVPLDNEYDREYVRRMLAIPSPLPPMPAGK